MRANPYLICAALLLPLSAFAVGTDDTTALHPEEAYPNNLPVLTSPGPYTEFVKQVQTRLHEEGFDAGPVNGDFGSKTQAALTQFQLGRDLDASGMLDQQTLKALGVQGPPQDEG